MSVSGSMEVTLLTSMVAIAGLLIMALLMTLQLVAVVRPRAAWTIDNVYGGSPRETDAKAYFAFHQGQAWADSFFWGPLQLVASIGMLAGQRWGFLLGLVASMPFVYTAILIFVWDRDLGTRRNTFTYWVIVWGMFPAYGAVEMIYCFVRLL